MQNCYVLFVKTGCEDNVANKLKTSSLLKPFVPKVEYFFIRNGLSEIKKKICFKGYVFIESNLHPEEFISLLSKPNMQSSEIIRILNYGNSYDIVIRDEERAALLKMFGKDYCLDISKAILVEGRVKITSGALVGMEGMIKRVKQSKKEVALEIDFMGVKREIWVGLDIIRKI